ncbi:MAG TPA: tRNA (N6-threonylcarbamoyladenosine(37)-N6)-methyltransferase TrmO [Polyangiaceae bacterium]|nr:tRNA (N6-threonylcarbamoyladenosine(37)-N6)-methyltransferase TrmO [Polyangiaceae bacterium]
MTDEPSFEASTEVLCVRPIGVVHSPFQERVGAPRQPAAARGVAGTVELHASSGIEHALLDLESFRFIWILFWFHKNHGFRPKVLPPRSTERRGVLATRSPYRPNPIGLSAVELVRIEGLVLHVRNLDLLDGTPVLDIKPYVPYTDSIPDANSGWLENAATPSDPLPTYRVEFSAECLQQLDFLDAQFGIVLRDKVESVLSLGPQPHPYRRIKRDGERWVLAHKEWRFNFDVSGTSIRVTRVFSGYRPSELFGSPKPGLEAHVALMTAFSAGPR